MGGCNLGNCMSCFSVYILELLHRYFHEFVLTWNVHSSAGAKFNNMEFSLTWIVHTAPGRELCGSAIFTYVNRSCGRRGENLQSIIASCRIAFTAHSNIPLLMDAHRAPEEICNAHYLVLQISSFMNLGTSSLLYETCDDYFNHAHVVCRWWYDIFQK